MKNESLSKWASIAEIIAAIGVILGLVFVGLQIEENNLETRAATIQASSDSQIELMSELLRYAGVWEKALNGETLEKGEEKRRAIILYNLIMADNANLFHQYQSGFLGEDNWTARQNTLRDLVALPIFEEWRTSIGGESHSQDYLDILEGHRQSLE